jgi:hypothetical protein
MKHQSPSSTISPLEVVKVVSIAYSKDNWELPTKTDCTKDLNKFFKPDSNNKYFVDLNHFKAEILFLYFLKTNGTEIHFCDYSLDNNDFISFTPRKFQEIDLHVYSNRYLNYYLTTDRKRSYEANYLEIIHKILIVRVVNHVQGDIYNISILAEEGHIDTTQRDLTPIGVNLLNHHSFQNIIGGVFRVFVHKHGPFSCEILERKKNDIYEAIVINKPN